MVIMDDNIAKQILIKKIIKKVNLINKYLL